jgi:hypothetical protein
MLMRTVKHLEGLDRKLCEAGMKEEIEQMLKLTVWNKTKCRTTPAESMRKVGSVEACVQEVGLNK